MRVDAAMIQSANLGGVMDALTAYTQRTGKRPYMLGGWDVEHPAVTPPPTLLHTIQRLRMRPRDYTYSRDFHEARSHAAAIFGQDMRLGGEQLTQSNIGILPNSSQGLFLALTAWREQGVRRIVIAAPCYHGIIAACHHLGLAIDLIPATNYLDGGLDIERLTHCMRRPDTALILTNPAYSLGVEYPPAHLQQLFARLPAGTPILMDETRLGLSWVYDAPWYAFDYPPQTVILRSPSKIFFLNGAKTSFLIGPSALIHQVEWLSESRLGSLVGNSEALTCAYLDTLHAWRQEVCGETRNPTTSVLAWKRATIAALIAHLEALHPVLERFAVKLSPVDSGPYVLAALPTDGDHLLDSIEIAREQGILVMASHYFYHTHIGWQGFRVHLAGNPLRFKKRITHVLASPIR